MKRELTLILRLSTLSALTAGGLWLFLNGYPFTALLVGLGALAIGGAILRADRSSTRRMERMIAAIRHSDLNGALTSFRTRLHKHVTAEAESEAWQKLIRVLTHEMMNSLTPIISLSQTILERAG